MIDLDLSKISFCNKNCYNICNNEFKKNILDTIKSKYGVTLNNNNLSQYDESKHFKFVNKNPYLISIKSQGNSYLLYLTKINESNSCLLIDKKILVGYDLPRILLVRYRFDDHLYENGGTLLEGELVKTIDENLWKFIINNIYSKSGNVLHINMTKKLTILRNILFNHYIYDPYLESCPLRVKKYYPFDKKNIPLLMEFMSKINYKVMSLELTPAYILGHVILVSTKSNVKLKIKPNISKKKSTIQKHANFIMSKTITPGIYQLYCHKNGFLTKHSIARIDGLECIQFIKEHFKSNNKLVVLCKYNSEFNKFTPLKLSERKKPDDFKDIIQITNEKK